MAEAAVAFLVEHAKEVVKEYKDLIPGSAEDEFHQLTKELGLVKDFLHGAAAATMQERHLLEEMEKVFKEVVHEVEDSIDTCFTKAMMSSRKPEIRGYGLAKEVKNIRDKLLQKFNYAKMQFSAVQIADGSGEDPLPKLKRCMPMKRKRVVDAEDMESSISGQLMKETKELDFISIIGMPGHGKTKLAWKIYENKNICFYFPTRIWVNISQEFSERDVFLQILKQLATARDMSNLDDEVLAQTVRSRLKKERFLLVLDDVWSVHALNKIKRALPLRNGKSKVLITSRYRDVISNNRPTFVLRFLTAHESWELLQFVVFGNFEDCPDELRGIGMQIVKKCDGMAHMIALVGGILARGVGVGVGVGLSVAVREWNMVAENLSTLLKQERWGIHMKVVALSYNRLPDYLRDCFLYLGVFPEDYEIPVKTLSALWIAEGFIQPEDGRSLEETAEESMNDLIWRNLLTVVKTNHIGKVITCRVHGIIRAFCISKSHDHNLFKEMKQSKEFFYHPPVSELREYRRLVCNFYLSNFLSQCPDGPHLRSFFCFHQQHKEVKPEYISAMLDGFPLLRVLEFRSIKLNQYPSKFMKLIHLRYLTLCADNLTVLPEALSQLWNLQTLVAETGSHSITMKANIWKMIQLRHLNTNVAVVLQDDTEREAQAGQNLHTLSKLSHESCTESVSGKAQKLKTLGIYGKLANVLRTKFLENLLHLENLKLVQGLIYEAASEDLLRGLPRHNCFPPSLRNLTLANTFLGWQHMPALATIKSLEALKLKDNAFVGVSWKVDAYDFPKLQLLLVVNTDLVHWEASPDSFPSLRYLVVKNCEKLEEIPESLGTNLEKLEIERLCNSAVKSAKRIETLRGKVAGEFNLKIGPGCER